MCRTGGLSQLTANPAEDTMPAWSPDDKEIAFISSRDNYKTAWAVNVATKAERQVASVSEGKIDAASYGPAASWSMNPPSPMTASSIWTEKPSPGRGGISVSSQLGFGE